MAPAFISSRSNMKRLILSKLPELGSSKKNRPFSSRNFLALISIPNFFLGKVKNFQARSMGKVFEI